MSRRSIALPSSQQPLLQVQSQSKSNSSQSYTLFKYRFAASSVLPSPRLINVSSCHFAACHFIHSSAEPLHRRWHAPPPASYDRHGSCHFNRSPAEPLPRRWHAPPPASPPSLGMVSCYTLSERCRCCWLSEDWLSSVMVPSRPTTTTLSR